MERYDTRARLFAATLAGLAGYVDAVGFVQSSGFFVSFMSGNSTRLGVGVAGSLPDAFAAAGLLISFVLGVTGGSLLGRASGRNRVPAVLASIAALLALAATLGVLNCLHASLAVTAFAMGAENATLEHQGQVRVGLTYMTGSLVRVGQAFASRLAGAGQGEWIPPLILWGGFTGGVVAGATAASILGFDALWVGGAVAITLAILSRMLSASLDQT